MPIDLGNNPTGTPPTSAQSLQIRTSIGAIGDAPNNSQQYTRVNGTWAALSSSGSGDPAVNTLVYNTSANWNNSYTTVNANSATWGTGTGSGDPAVNTLVHDTSGSWNSAYTTVNANSATTWNYQGADLKALSGNWDSTYTTVNANSAAWIGSGSYSSLIGNNVTNPLTATHNLNTKDIVFSVREVSSNKIIYAAGKTVDSNNLELTFNTIPTTNQYDITILSNGGVVGSSGGGETTNVFALNTINTLNYNQISTYTNTNYNDSAAGGVITVSLLPVLSHIGVTQHKKIGSTANVVLSAPAGVTIDGQPTFTLRNQYEAIGLYTDGTNYFIQ